MRIGGSSCGVSWKAWQPVQAGGRRASRANNEAAGASRKCVASLDARSKSDWPAGHHILGARGFGFWRLRIFGLKSFGAAREITGWNLRGEPSN